MEATKFIDCACGSRIPESESRTRAATGHRLQKPQCKDCNERDLRQSSRLDEFRSLGETRAFR